MESKALSYGKTYINKNEFHKEAIFNIGEAKFKKIILFDKISYVNKGSFIYYTGYIDNG